MQVVKRHCTYYNKQQELNKKISRLGVQFSNSNKEEENASMGGFTKHTLLGGKKHSLS